MQITEDTFKNLACCHSPKVLSGHASDRFPIVGMEKLWVVTNLSSILTWRGCGRVQMETLAAVFSVTARGCRCKAEMARRLLNFSMHSIVKYVVCFKGWGILYSVHHPVAHQIYDDYQLH